MADILIHGYERRKPGRKTSKIEIGGYKRYKRRKSGKIRKEGEIVRLGQLRDPKTGWFLGSYRIKTRRRAKSKRKPK